ncbi:somatostatin receptor type 2 [Plakobranchus ocellatus]|uniref:Somatostatin receptor type 2 n=1 Tax=Plakobranchus ocellatus TaxID=259542 RepID=A0AAV4AS43_9GAST|nr:somatostatin receptor type 2 [Plakobranchus ocellatus]
MRQSNQCRFLYPIRFLNVESIDGNANLKTYICAVVVVWISQAALASPMAVWNTVVSYGSSRKCQIPFSDLPQTLDYTLAMRVIAFFCPLCIMWICNLGVIYKLRRMDRKILPLAGGVSGHAMRKRRSRKVTLTCLMLAGVFTVNLTPFQILLLITQTGTPTQVRSAINAMQYVWLLTVLNCCLNPFIYGFVFQNLKRRIAQNCFCLKQREATSQRFGPPKSNTNFNTENSGGQNFLQAISTLSTNAATSDSGANEQWQQQQQQQEQQQHLQVPSVQKGDSTDTAYRKRNSFSGHEIPNRENGVLVAQA